MIQILKTSITRSELKRLAEDSFGDFIKGVVDIRSGLLAIGGELHADEEALLLQNGSEQRDLWGINLYPSQTEKEMIEFDSMINVRPGQGNRSRGVESEEVRNRIIEVVTKLVTG